MIKRKMGAENAVRAQGWADGVFFKATDRA
jgi:hypothetical protein